MPMQAPIACTHPGCKEQALHRSHYCKNHQTKDSGDNRQSDRQRYRDQPWRALYNAPAWRVHLRPFILARDPLCKLQITELCKQHGGDGTTVADHIRDHKGDPALFFDPKNLRGVCKPCHDKKTGGTRDGGRLHKWFCLIAQGVCNCPVADTREPYEIEPRP